MEITVRTLVNRLGAVSGVVGVDGVEYVVEATITERDTPADRYNKLIAVAIKTATKRQGDE